MTVFVVGGAVRDRLLKRPTSDIDLIVPKDPAAAAEKIARAMGGSAFPLDAERGIIRVAFPDGPHLDLAQIQGGSLEADLKRRDFTANALAVPIHHWPSAAWSKAIIDLSGGRGDIGKRRLVPLSKSVYDEDPLRLLRAFRIAAELSFSISKPALQEIAKKRNLLKKPASDRIREELLKIFATGRAYATLQMMEEAGVLEVLLPEVKKLRKTAPQYYGKGGVLRHTLESVKFFEEIMEDLSSWFPGAAGKIRAYLADSLSGYPRTAHLKWALLLHDLGKPKTAKRVGGRLRFFEHEHVGADMVVALGPKFRWSAEETSRYARLVRNHMRPGNLASHAEITDKAIHRFFRDLGDDAVGMILVSLADHLTYLTPGQRRKRSSSHERAAIKMIRRYYSAPERVLPPRILSGFDVMEAFNLPPSPLIGELLQEAKEAQAEGKIKTREEALNFLKERLKSRDRL